MNKDIKYEKLHKFESESFVRDSTLELFLRCQEKNLDVRTVICTLLEESMEKAFMFSYSSENAGKLILSIFERILDKHIFDDESSEALLIELENQEDHRTH